MTFEISVSYHPRDWIFLLQLRLLDWKVKRGDYSVQLGPVYVGWWWFPN